MTIVYFCTLMYMWLCAIAGSSDNVLVDCHRKWTEGLFVPVSVNYRVGQYALKM